MKKITLLLALLITSIGFSQTTELLTNGDFENDKAPWGGSEFTVVDGEAFFSATNAAGNLWDTQLTHGGLAFENAKEYVLTFYARAAADRKITVAIQNVGIWNDQFRQEFDLTTTMTKFTTTFNATSDNANVQIGFLMAGSGSSDAIYYDDISLVTAAADPAADATLIDLTVDATTVSGFSASNLTYNIELPEGTTVVPTVLGTTAQSSPATAVTTAATELPGTSTVLVTAQDLNTTKTYTINFTVAVTITPPTVAAPTPPTRDAADVVSIYSDAYAAISPINYDESWCGAGAVTATTAGGDNVLAYNSQACQGIGFADDKKDVTGLTNMHVDLFIAEGTDLVGKVFNVKVVYSAGGETSFNIDINGLSPAPVPGNWYSYDAPVNITGSNIQQVGITSNLNNVVWYDNLYFWKEAVDTETDITLSDLTIDGTTVAGFETDKLTYDIILPKGTTIVPTVLGTPTQSSPAAAVTTAATELPGTSTILVTAKDGSTTETYTVNFIIDTNTECEGVSSDSQQTGFSNGGYSYSFETLANGDVRMTFELLEVGAVGVLAYSWKEAPFQELGMTVTGTVATIDLTGYSDGDVISHAVKFVWASGGFGVTKYLNYTVGEDCGGTSEDTTLEDASLSDLTVSGTTVSGFSAGTLSYDIELPYGTVVVPTVIGTATQSAPATAVTTDATILPGTSTVLVTAQDGTTTSTYTLNFTVVGPSVTLPLDFSDASQAFEWDPSGGTGGDAIINTTSEKLEIFGNGHEWDNAFIAFSGADVVDLSNDAANTITFTIQSTTALAGEVHTHLMKLTGAGVYETDFTTTGQEVKTVFIDPPALGDLTELRIFVDKGGTDGGTYLVDDIALFVDTEVPTNFTATVGTIGAFGVELLLNATDNSGSVTYDISYNGGANTVQTIGSSGVQKSFTISELTPETAYSFEVSASDGKGNVATNNPISGLDATTIADTSNECVGFSSESLEGSFSVGINYSFVTSGTDVTITFEILDTDKTGLNPQIFIEPSTFINMDQSNAPTYTATLTDQTLASDISFSFRAAYAGGLVRSKVFTYTVGEDCSTLGTNDFDLGSFSANPNPTSGSLNISAQSTIKSAAIYNLLGKQVMSLEINKTSESIDVSNLSSGIYLIKYTVNNAVGTAKFIKE